MLICEMWILLYSTLAVFHLASAACPGDWLNITTGDNPSQACYKIFSAERRTFSAAATFCQSQGGYLAMDTTATIHDALKQALYDAVKSDTHPIVFWIGLTDNKGAGSPWMWLNGTALGTYQNFANPNVTNTPNKTDCVFISAGSLNMKWYVTTDCDRTYSLICQRDVNAPPIVHTTHSPLNCPSGWTSYYGLQTCIKLYITPLSWTSARSACQQLGADLVKIINSDEDNYVNSLIATQRDIYWIGLNDRANEGKFVWLDETVKANFTNWDANMPDNEGGSEDCVAVDGNKNYLWDDGDCRLPNRFICQRNPLAGTKPPQVVTSVSNTNCDAGWLSVPNSDSCVQFNTNVLSWLDARAACQSAGGNLASIGSDTEQVYLVGQSHSLTSDFFWIGANDRGTQNGWQWTDGSPFAFLNWDNQQPDNRNNADCAGFVRQSGRWDALPCQSRQGYICKKKGKVTLGPIATTSTTPATLPSDMVFGCPSGWTTFRGSCYKFAVTFAGVNWVAANSSCAGSLNKAALVAIIDGDENDFIASMLPTNYSGAAWIGLQDPVENTFTWADGTPVQYTNWNVDEPNNLDNADCVLMSTANGEWSVVSCDRLAHMYICKKGKSFIPVGESNQNPGCQTGSVPYGTQCYTFVRTPQNSSAAEQDCKSRSSNYGNLVTVYSSQVQDFLTSHISTLPDTTYWIGLSQIGPMYSWQSHWPISLTYWGRNHTGTESDTCVAMLQDMTTNNWINYPCTNVMPYICESTRTGYATQVPETVTTNQQPCPPGWPGYGNYCYKMFGNGMTKLAWGGAQSDCGNQAVGGSLVTVTDSNMQTWLRTNIASTFPLISTIWIGLNDRDAEGSYVWADNSPLLYTNWAPNEPNDAMNREDCVAWIVSKNFWNDDYCYMSNSYICQVPRGTVIATIHPPFTGYITPQCGDSSWIMYNLNCYYMSPAYGDGSLVTWFEARQKCLDMGADLASITSSDENGFLTIMTNKIAVNNFWIGLNDLDLETFAWTDFSPVIYVSWDINEPDDAYGEEKCVEINSVGLWNDAQCQEKFGYFCKKMPGNYSPTPNINTPPTGGCPPNFVSLPILNYCYFVGGTTNDTRQNYTGAMQACKIRAPNSQLASIKSNLEEKYVLILTSSLHIPAWIGLNDRRIRNSFEWVDDMAVSYSNWGPGQPDENLHDNSPGARKDCVDVEVRQNPGTWNDRSCDTPLAYICESRKVPTMPTAAPDTTGCPQGYQKFRNSCYKFFEDPLNWTSAESVCKQDGGNVVTLNSGVEQAFAEILVQLSQLDITQFWIGLRHILASSSFTWADGWPIWYTNWAENEPKILVTESCVTHTVDARWQVAPCVMELSFVCEINFGSPPPSIINRPGRCPNNNTWFNYAGYCYHIETSTPSTWAEANTACRILGANLTSIHSADESWYLTNSIGSVLKDVWIGLFKGQGTGFTWYDGSETEYTNWGVGEPNDPDSYLHQDCVKIVGQYGTWADTDCSDKNAYICKMQQRPRPTLGPNQTYSSRPWRHHQSLSPNATYPSRHQSLSPNAIYPSRHQSLSPNATYPSRHQSLGPNATYPSRHSTSPPLTLGQKATDNDPGLSAGSVSGIIIGVLMLVLLGVLIGYLVLRYSRRHKLLPSGLQRLQAASSGFTNISYTTSHEDKVTLTNDA